MSTESASANLSSRERDIRHLECRRQGIPIDEPIFPKNDDHDPQLSDDFEADLGLAWQLIEDVNATQQPNPDNSAQAETAETRNEQTPQAPPPASPAPTDPYPGTTKIPVQQTTRTPDLVGVSILGAAVLYQFSPELANLLKILTSWGASILPRPELTRQFVFTVLFMFMPLWIGIFKVIKGILHWNFLLVENNRLDKAMKICKEKLRLLDVGIAQSKEIIVLQNELIELKKRQRELLEQESAKKKKGLKKKKRSIGIKKEDKEGKAR
ncbi:MAG: hypothetical protein L6R42_004541 [Xanthoria sp. 1 TBL-2021]|nr:MAG: hypothetical protein L6R42_004541 [Xanthoria sp. 1 TBL-2021]